jgi:hypothetical protein
MIDNSRTLYRFERAGELRYPTLGRCRGVVDRNLSEAIEHFNARRASPAGCPLPHALFSLYDANNTTVCRRFMGWKHHQVSFQLSRLSLLCLA